MALYEGRRAKAPCGVSPGVCRRGRGEPPRQRFPCRLVELIDGVSEALGIRLHIALDVAAAPMPRERPGVGFPPSFVHIPYPPVDILMPDIREVLSCILYHTLGAKETGKSDQLITPCLTGAEQIGEKGRLRTIHDLDAAAIRRPLPKGRLCCEVVV